MNKKLVLNPNMATTQMLQFIKPPETFDIGGDAEKFIEECEKFFELTQRDIHQSLSLSRNNKEI